MSVREDEDLVPPVPNKMPKTKALALYLPQFHPIRANDRAWGKGFTEWTNVARGRPEFTEHQQPKIPRDLGFYDLRLGSIQREQVKIAKNAGIYGFCYYHYWFDGEEPLAMPLDRHREDPEIDFHFAVCFANENWTKRWDGLDDEVIYRQAYGENFAERYWKSVVRFLISPKYVTDSAGRPILLIYRPSLIPDFQAVAEKWRILAGQAGLPGLQLVGCLAFEKDSSFTPGLDAFYEFPPLRTLHHTAIHRCGPKQRVHRRVAGSCTHVYDYRENVMAARVLQDYPSSFIPGVMPGWDNVARRPRAGGVVSDSTPALFEEWVTLAARRAQRRPDPFLVVNAWNEWAEGAYLEADRTTGWQYLHALSKGLLAAEAEQAPEKKKPIGVFVHVHYEDIWAEISAKIAQRINVPYFLVVTSEKNIGLEQTSACMVGFQNIIVENKGRDVLPFIRAIEECKFDFEIALKIHTKKSPHRADGTTWRNILLDALIPTIGVGKHVEAFGKDRNLGFIAPQGHYVPVRDYIGSNLAGMERLGSRLGIQITEADRDRWFIAGSMFWFRRAALNGWRYKELKDLFAPETGQLDGTAAHAAERFFAIAGERNGYFTVPVEEVDNLLASTESCAVYPLAHRLTFFSDQRPAAMRSLIALSRVDAKGLTIRAVTRLLVHRVYNSGLLRRTFRGLPERAKRPIRLTLQRLIRGDAAVH